MAKDDSTDLPAPPAGLNLAGRRLWLDVVADLELAAHELRVLRDACAVADTIAALERALPAATLVTAGPRGGLTLHPAVAELRMQRIALASLLSKIKVPPRDAAAKSAETPESRSAAARRAALIRWHGAAGTGA